MKLVHFTNKGFINPSVWSTFGISAKETDNCIGQFGTGLKYAIAVLLREGRCISIKSDKEYVFSVKEKEFRGKTFQQVTCNDQELPFTTELGKSWELWQAYRELYSNCLDEQGCLGDHLDTTITADIGDIQHSSVFLQSTPVVTGTNCEVHPGESKYIYHKGIRTMDLSGNSLFTYNILEAELTEDRTFKNSYSVDRAISDCVIQNPDSDFSYDFLTKTKHYAEEHINVDLWATTKPTGKLLELVDTLRKDNVYLQPSLAKACISQLGPSQYITTEPTQYQQQVINKAVTFLKSTGTDIHYPIFVCSDLGSSTLAIADRRQNRILLSDTVLTQGVKQVASTLYEEWLHLAKGYDDCTYQMQTYLFDQIITLSEQLHGEVL